jgi:hypothetical protein
MNRLIRMLFLNLACVTALIGCTITDSSAIVTGTTRDPATPDTVKIYTTPPVNYEEIALISASAAHDFRSDGELIDEVVYQLKVKAASLGANAILLTMIDERDDPITSVGSAYGNVTANNGTSLFGSTNSVMTQWGDSHTRMKAIAIFIPQEVVESAGKPLGN